MSQSHIPVLSPSQSSAQNCVPRHFEDFNQSLRRVTFPNGLKHLHIGDHFEHHLDGVTLPALESLMLGARFNHSLEHVTFPKTLLTLDLGDRFNQALLPGVLPQNLEHLILGDRFNQSLKALPASLKTLSAGHRFNTSLAGISFPKGLKSLTFGIEFNQSLEQVHLPEKLENLAFGHRFNQRIVWLPESLQSLTFGALVCIKFEFWSCDHEVSSAFVKDFRHSPVFPNLFEYSAPGAEFNQPLKDLGP